MSRTVRTSTKDREPALGEVPLTRVGVITYDSGGRCTWANVAAAELLSISREALLGQDLNSSGFWRDSGLLPYVETALAGVPHRAVIAVGGAQGGPRQLDVRLEQVTGAGQLALLAVFANVTPLLRLESALRGSRERFRELVDETPDFLFSLDASGTLTAANKSLADAAGCPLPQLVGRRLEEVGLPAELAAQWERARERVASTRAPLEFESLARLSDGKNHVLEVTLRPIMGGGKAAIGARGSARDITERLAMEEQLRQAQKMEALGQLAGGIAHDFNNLLTAIIGNSDLALGAIAPDDPSRPLIEEVRTVGERAAGLTRQILAFSRRQELRPQMVCLNEVLGDLEPLLRRTLGEDIDVNFHLAADLAQTEVDPSQMEQVVMNLVLNARDAMAQGGRLTLETANVELDRVYARTHLEVRPGPHVMLAVSDTGCGMTKETAARVFEPFFTTKDPGKGTGLGLSTVFGIVKQSEGNISLYSEPGMGTTFKVYLPRATSAPPAIPEAATGNGLAQGSGIILVVEDDPSLRNLVARVLTRAGYEVFQAGSIRGVGAALRKAKRPPDLLLTDVVLPGGGSGSEVAEMLRERHRGLKVLFMSGYTRDSAMHNGRLDEGIEFLEKPFTPETLLQKVRLVLDTLPTATGGS